MTGGVMTVPIMEVDTVDHPSPGEAPAPRLDAPVSLSVLDMSPIGAAVIAPDLTIHYANRRLRQLLELPEAYRVPIDGRAIFGIDGNHSASDRLIRLLVGENAFECELRRADGQTLRVLTNARAIRFEGAHNSLVWFQDITASHLSTMALKEREQRLALAVTGARLAVWEADLLTGQRWWSAEFYRMLGYAEAVATAEDDDNLWHRHLHPEDAQHVQAKLAAYLARPADPTMPSTGWCGWTDPCLGRS